LITGRGDDRYARVRPHRIVLAAHLGDRVAVADDGGTGGNCGRDGAGEIAVFGVFGLNEHQLTVGTDGRCHIEIDRSFTRPIDVTRFLF